VQLGLRVDSFVGFERPPGQKLSLSIDEDAVVHFVDDADILPENRISLSYRADELPRRLTGTLGDTLRLFFQIDGKEHVGGRLAGSGGNDELRLFTQLLEDAFDVAAAAHRLDGRLSEYFHGEDGDAAAAYLDEPLPQRFRFLLELFDGA